MDGKLPWTAVSTARGDAGSCSSTNDSSCDSVTEIVDFCALQYAGGGGNKQAVLLLLEEAVGIQTRHYKSSALSAVLAHRF